MAKPPNEKPTASEFGQLRSYLAQNGMSQADIDEALGTNGNQNTRAETADLLKAYLKNVPAAGS